MIIVKFEENRRFCDDKVLGLSNFCFLVVQTDFTVVQKYQISKTCLGDVQKFRNAEQEVLNYINA